MAKRVEAIVIGGGVIGASVFYHLCRAGIEPLLLERDDLMSGTAGGSDGFVIMQTKKPGIHLELALASRKCYQHLAEDLGMDVGYRQKGGYFIAQNQSEYDGLTQLCRQQSDCGLDVRMLDSAQLLCQEPQISPAMLGASYSPMDGVANPLKVVRGYVKAARSLGAQVMAETNVLDIVVDNGKVQGVKTSRGEFHTNIVINACGVWAPQIGELVGLQIPIKPRMGQILVTEPVGPFVHGVMLCGRYFALKHQKGGIAGDDELTARLSLSFGIEQTEDGTMLLTNTREWVGFDRRNSQEGIDAIMKNAVKYLPGLKELHIIRTFAGLRPYTPDSLPILGPVDGLTGFYMAAGHEGDGIALSPITGQLVAEQVAHGAASISLEPLNLRRFTSGAVWQA